MYTITQLYIANFRLMNFSDSLWTPPPIPVECTKDPSPSILPYLYPHLLTNTDPFHLSAPSCAGLTSLPHLAAYCPSSPPPGPLCRHSPWLPSPADTSQPRLEAPVDLGLPLSWVPSSHLPSCLGLPSAPAPAALPLRSGLDFLGPLPLSGQWHSSYSLICPPCLSLGAMPQALEMQTTAPWAVPIS